MEPEKKTGGARAIYGFSDDDIWVVGNGIWRKIGDNWRETGIDDEVLDHNGEYTSLWGTSSSNLYLGNQWGKIIHWDGEKAEVEFEKDGYTITGIGGANENNIYAVGVGGSNYSQPLILYFSNGIWEEDENLSGSVFTPSNIYVVNSQEIFISGSGILYGHKGNWKSIQTGTSRFYSSVSGISSNNVFFVGNFNAIAHWNGLEIHEYSEIYSPDGGGLGGVYVAKDKIIAVGTTRGAEEAKIISSK